MFVFEHTTDKDKVNAAVQFLNLPERLEEALGAYFKATDLQRFIMVYYAGWPVGVLVVEQLSNTVLNIHPIMLPRMMARKYMKMSFDALVEHLRKYSNIEVLTITFPASLSRVIKMAARMEFKACGVIPQGIVHDGVKQDMLIFYRNISQSEN